MGKKHKIGWLNVPGYIPQTWNPIVGCSKISAGCQNCYAERDASSGRLQQFDRYREVCDEFGNWNGKTVLHEPTLFKPLKWKKPRSLFPSMTDPFHESIPDEWITELFITASLCPQHLFIVLTKRADRMEKYITRACDDAEKVLTPGTWPLKNVWLGVTAENQEMADQRIPHLLSTPAAVRFVSCEPMIGEIELRIPVGCRHCNHPGNVIERSSCTLCGGTGREPSVDWVICGGESGPGARPMNPEWALSLRDQCFDYGVPFFFKQWGYGCHGLSHLDYAGFDYSAGHNGGDILDGRQWHEFPTIGKTKGGL